MFAPLLLAAALASTHSTGNSPGEFKGYQAINTAVSARWIVPAQYPFQLSPYFGDDYSGGLSRLLGSFQAGEFRNGAPNALNMMLWYIGMNGLATAVETSVCVDHTPQLPGTPWSLNAHAYEALSAACTLPEDAAARAQVLLGVWLATVSYDAPKAEFDAWRADLSGQPLATMLTGALLDPYFLLEH